MKVETDTDTDTDKTLKFTKHITFYCATIGMHSSNVRIYNLNKIIDETNNYKHKTDIFLHTNNKSLTIEHFNKYTNGTFTLIIHDLTDIHPYFLSWKCRDLLKQQKDDYDVFMYIEDDILVPYKSIEYWLKYSNKLTENGHNLGFVRIETLHGVEYITDLLKTEKFDKFIVLQNEPYVVNDINPYCAFWIYDKNEFNRFVNSQFYDINNINDYGIREKSAIGLHGLFTNWYKNTVIPIVNNNLIDDCKIYHLSNNYVNDKHSSLAKVEFEKCIKKYNLQQQPSRASRFKMFS